MQKSEISTQSGQHWFPAHIKLNYLARWLINKMIFLHVVTPNLQKAGISNCICAAIPVLSKPAYRPLQGTGGGVQVVQGIPG